MNTDQWFYGEPGGEVHGPLGIRTIRAAVEAGRLTEAVSLSQSAEGPWAPLRVVEKIGRDAFGAGGKKKAALLDAKLTGNPPGKSVAGFVEVIGFVFLLCGVFSIIGIFVSWFQSSPLVSIYMIAALSNFISGVMFLAVAEILRRLSEISSGVRSLKSDR
jgi:hypothetical protein